MSFAKLQACEVQGDVQSSCDVNARVKFVKYYEEKMDNLVLFTFSFQCLQLSSFKSKDLFTLENI